MDVGIPAGTIHDLPLKSEVMETAKSANHTHGNYHLAAVFQPLRELHVLAASLDIIIDSLWIAGSTNDLADALSRFDIETVANLCPHWQGCFPAPTPQPGG
ncbi:hypothetical protein EAE96_010981 [Botrytis aclada]|nr:hypothetical protein EAE96_010981 [Botrytis aclada]